MTWVDVEGHEGQGVEGGRVAHRDFVGGSDGHRGHVGACTTADVRNAVLWSVDCPEWRYRVSLTLIITSRKASE